MLTSREKSLCVPSLVMLLTAKYQVAGARLSIMTDVMLGLPTDSEYAYWPDTSP